MISSVDFGFVFRWFADWIGASFLHWASMSFGSLLVCYASGFQFPFGSLFDPYFLLLIPFSLIFSLCSLGEYGYWRSDSDSDSYPVASPVRRSPSKRKRNTKIQL